MLYCAIDDMQCYAIMPHDVQLLLYCAIPYCITLYCAMTCALIFYYSPMLHSAMLCYVMLCYVYCAMPCMQAMRLGAGLGGRKQINGQIFPKKFLFNA